MDLSDFKPPVRLAMTDEEIYQALGQAQATEDGLAKAMAIVEEQANLREHDAQVLREWVARMQQDPRPQARIALENLERAKQGLEALPLDSAPELEQPVEVIEDEEVTIEIPVEVIPVVEPAVDSDEVAFAEFEALLEDAAAEATSAISIPQEQPVAVTYEEEPASELIPAFEVAADEDALVDEETAAKAKVHGSGWWGSAAFWLLTSGVVTPLAAAFLSAKAGFSFGTAAVGFGLGSLLTLGLIVANHYTANRTENDLLVTKRASFGVLGGILPGLATFSLTLVAFVLGSMASVKSFDNVFSVSYDTAAPLFGFVTLGGALSAALVVIALVVAKFLGKWQRCINAVTSILFVIAFVISALLTRSEISFGDVDANVDFGLATVFAFGVFSVGALAVWSSPKVLPRAGKSNTAARWAGIVFGVVVLPLAAFAHFQLVYAQNPPSDAFALLEVFGRTDSGLLMSPVLWIYAATGVVLLVNLASASIREVKSFALNRVPGWLVAILAVLATAIVFVPVSFEAWIGIVQLLTYPILAVAGVSVADAVLRRGLYHEASLQRSYGFYGAFNYFGLFGFALAVAVGFATAPAINGFEWLGFANFVTPLAPALTFGTAILWTVLTGIPRIKVQQKEVAEVDQRKASLNTFTGFSE